MKTLKIKFSGMGGDFCPENNFIINILRKCYKIELSDKPDYLIYSVNSKDYLNYNCIRIYFTPENLTPDFNICDYAIGFHYIDFEDRYIRFPLYLVNGFRAYKKDDYALDLQLAMKKHDNVKYKLNKKTKFCSFVYSNSQAALCREKLFETLSQYKLVSSGGRYKNNIGKPVEDKLKFQEAHKFVIAFENTSTSGYTTEKIVGAFAAGAIPIYWGNPKIEEEFNAGSFINCNALGLTEKGEPEAIEKIVEVIKKIDKDDSTYLQMLSTPAFTVNNDANKQLERFEKFLCNIFDQPLEKAYRRNRFYWGERYERKQKIGNRFYWMCRKVIPVRDFVKKFVKKVSIK